jgi:pilus assembly protein CpaB
VTLEASTYDAERIVVAGRLGKLTLVVRAAAEGQAAAGAGLKAGTVPSSAGSPIAWGGDVSPALRDHPVNKAGVSIRVYRGSKDSEEVKF